MIFEGFYKCVYERLKLLGVWVRSYELRVFFDFMLFMDVNLYILYKLRIMVLFKVDWGLDWSEFFRIDVVLRSFCWYIK